LLGDGSHNHRTGALHALGADHDQPGLVLPGHIQKHLRHRALANLRVAMDALAKQVAGQFVQHRARLFGQPGQNLAGNRIHFGIFYGVDAVRHYNPRTIGSGQLAGILQSGFRAAAQISGHDNGLQAACKTHERLRGNACYSAYWTLSLRSHEWHWQ
jgi:hypothetical protein